MKMIGSEYFTQLYIYVKMYANKQTLLEEK